MVAQAYGGQQRGGLMCIGGVDKDAKDITNDLTYMLLDAFLAFAKENYPLNEPQVDIRIHSETPKELIFKALELIKLGTGYPSFFNDKALIPLKQRQGWDLEDARNFINVFCVTHNMPATPRYNMRWGCTSAWVAWFNWVKIVNWALNKGIDPETGEQKGAVTKDP